MKKQEKTQNKNGNLVCASMQHHTYCPGADNVEDLASRAREIGVQHRAARLHRQSTSRNSAGAGMLIMSARAARLQVAVLAAKGAEEEDEEERPLEGAAVRRMPSWLEEATRERKAGFTLVEAFFASCKSVVGPAVLYMPNGFKEGGLTFGVGMLLLSYTLFGTGAMRLLESWRLHRKSYGALMGKAFGKRGVVVVRFTIVAQQCGVCLTYLVFVATNARELYHYLRPHVKAPSLAWFCLAQVVVYVPLCCVRDVQNFAYTNLVANCLIVYSLIVLAAFASASVSHESFEDLQLFNPNAFYLFIGTSAFIYEGAAALVVPLQEAVREDLQEHFAPLFLKTAGGIVCLYIMFGIVNWAAYGSHTQTVLTVNLPRGNWKASVQFAYLLAVVFTFPLQLFPAIQIFKSLVHKLQSISRRRNAGYAPVDAKLLPGPRNRLPKHRALGNCARAILVLALAGISILEVHSLDKLVALIGGLLGIPLAFIYPMAIHLKLVPDAPLHKRRFNRVGIAIGAVLSVACTAVTIATW